MYNWHYGNKNNLRTFEAQIVQQLKNNEAWSKFTGSYKKACNWHLRRSTRGDVNTLTVDTMKVLAPQKIYRVLNFGGWHLWTRKHTDTPTHTQSQSNRRYAMTAIMTTERVIDHFDIWSNYMFQLLKYYRFTTEFRFRTKELSGSE